MDIPLQISFHGLQHSDAVAEAVHHKARGLERYYDHITSCRVVVEHSTPHRHEAKQFVVQLDIKVPGSEIAISHKHDADWQVALHQAFDAARRQLEDYARERRGDVKRHPAR